MKPLVWTPMCGEIAVDQFVEHVHDVTRTASCFPYPKTARRLPLTEPLLAVDWSAH